MANDRSRTIAAAVSTAFLTAVTLSPAALAGDNPFRSSELQSGYQMAGDYGKEGNDRYDKGSAQGGSKSEQGRPQTPNQDEDQGSWGNSGWGKSGSDDEEKKKDKDKSDKKDTKDLY